MNPTEGRQAEKLWQESSNSCWFSDQKQVCDLCGKKTDRVMEVEDPLTGESGRYCMFNGRFCAITAIQQFFFSDTTSEYVSCRSIEYRPVNKRKSREPIGLALRYAILKRDKFKCVKCGSSGSDVVLEVDHIIPVSMGGATTKKNLQTLCFACNRGKRDSL